MSPPHDSAPGSPPLSIAERLRRVHGREVDPRIELGAPRPAAVPAAGEPRSPSSSRVLGRLGTHAALASRYTLEGEIARGGMGAILAVYDEDLRRRLAMKVILDDAGGAATSGGSKVDPSRLARFLEEAQVTGQLDHPGIVPVHELGLDAGGHVYFTMRLVHGRNLEAVFQLVPSGAEGWTTTRALGVLLKVCESMAYAHSKGVVHRDLKPANVMVGQFGEVYVMDWGLAHVRDHTDRHDVRLRRERPENKGRIEVDRREDSVGAEGENLYTLDGDVVGTPAYMSPEQALGKLAEIGAASDVYSFGAMLYRLLTGVAPHAAEGEALSPFVVLERLLAGPPTPIEALAPAAPAELVAICEKAMAREPLQRYPNMLALAEDLRAFLEGRVVAAFETGTLAETRKWVRRNRALAGALAAAVLALVAGLAASLVLGRRASASAVLAEQRRSAAEVSAQAAQREARITEEVNSFLNQDLLSAVAPEFEGADVTVREVLDRAALRLGARFQDEPAVEAALRDTIGSAYSKLGLYEPARTHLERALALRRAHEGTRAETTFRTELELANVLTQLGRFDQAIAAYEETLAKTRATLGPESEASLSAMSDLGIVLEKAGRFDQARPLFEQALEIERRVLGVDHDITLSTEGNLAILDQDEGRLAEAERGFRHVFESRRARDGERRPETLTALSNLSIVLKELGRVDEAEDLARQALVLARDVYGPEHPATSRMEGNLGVLVWQRSRPQEAEELLADALRIARASYGEEHPATLQLRDQLAGVRLDLGRALDSLAEFTAVLEVERRVLGVRHPQTLETLNRLALAYSSLERYDEAEPMQRELIDSYREVLGADHPATLVALENLANLLFSRGALRAAEGLVREVLAARRRVLGAEHPDVAKTTFNLGMVLEAEGDGAGALAQFEQALELMRAGSNPGDPLKAECLMKIGDRRASAGRPELALDAYGESLEVRNGLGIEDATSAYLQHQIGAAQVALGDFEAARISLEAALVLRERLLGHENGATNVTLGLLLTTLKELRRFDEAEPLALDFHELALGATLPDPARILRARRLLVEIYEGLGRTDEAEKWR